MQTIKLFEEIYGPSNTERFKQFLNKYESVSRNYKLDSSDSFLITYGDSIISEKNGFETLFSTLETKVGDSIKNVHILPMYPYTSDDGFSVIDYEQVRNDLGTWEELASYSSKYGLMYDFVINHMSKSSQWFKEFTEGKNNYFIEYDEGFDYSKVVRPRVSPLFHEINGKNVWTTFSEDQVDLNFKEYDVFEEATRILIDYCKNGATFIRLDAIGFMWKESGTSCIHLENTHKIIKLWRLILDEIFGDKFLITETNVPHQENISYFGESNEAHMVYNFALPPLVADAILSGNSKFISEWMNNLETIENCTYFNFLSSHDGIGLRPVEALLPEENIQNIVDNTFAKGGRINYKNNTDGTKSPYECNINYYSLLKEKDEYDVDRLLCATFILNSIKGCPAIYVHTLFGSENDIKGMELSGINRRINREQLVQEQLLQELDSDCDRKEILLGIKKQLDVRKSSEGFDPYGEQSVEVIDERLIVINRINNEKDIVCIANISDIEVSLESELIGYSLLDECNVKISKLMPYEYMWIERG